MEKEVFERMVNEFEGVNEKVVKLRDFITDKEKFETLDFINRDLLIAQLKAMETYLSILSIRIGLNAKPTEEVVETVEE
jgi:hypothetical protein